MRHAVRIALAFVGLLVGAGFASGQETIQYFLTYGTWGIVGAILAGILIVIAGAVLFQLGSYFLAENHNAVFQNVTHPVVSKVLDVSTMITLFCIGFVMIAGGGSNLEQQFGLPVWVGAGIMTLLLIVSGFLDVDKLTNVISAITPFLVLSVLGAFVLTILNMEGANIGELNELAMQNQAASGVFNNWFVSAVNYAALCVITGVSMILVVAGSNLNPRRAGTGGLVGGMLFSVLLIILVFVLFFNMEDVFGADMPLLMVFDGIHPAVGFVVAIVIYLMIYNTAVGMFYGMSRRITATNPARFRLVYIGVVLVGFALSFVGFADLVSWVFPVLGYLGMFLVAVLFASWGRNRAKIYRESERRERLAELARIKLEPESDGLKPIEKSEVRALVSESPVENASLWEMVQEDVAADLDTEPDVNQTGDAISADVQALASMLSAEEIDSLPDGPVKRDIVSIRQTSDT